MELIATFATLLTNKDAVLWASLFGFNYPATFFNAGLWSMKHELPKNSPKILSDEKTDNRNYRTPRNGMR